MSQHVIDFDHRKFLINQNASLLKTINHNDGANFPLVNSVFTANK